MSTAPNANDAPQERILLSYPDVSDLQREALLRAFDSGWIAPLGPWLRTATGDGPRCQLWPCPR